MPAIEIPDPLPPAITLPREVVEVARLGPRGVRSLMPGRVHLALGLTRRGQGPISHMNWSQFDGDGPPSAATLAAESTAAGHHSSSALRGWNSQGPVHLLVVHSGP